MKYDGNVIHSVRDQYGLIEVVENHVTRKLYFDSPVEQSCLYLNAPMTLNFEYQEKIIERVQSFSQQHKPHKPLRVLMLGMGGGSMAHHLFHLLPNLQMTVVELRQAVIDCAFDYFQLPNEPEIEVVQQNALTFMAENQYEYDIILVDIFDAQGLPSEMGHDSFQQSIWQSLKSPGLVIYNLWFQWDQTHRNTKPVETQETQNIMQHWHTMAIENTGCSVNRYNIKSSQNLIAEVHKT